MPAPSRSKGQPNHIALATLLATLSMGVSHTALAVCAGLPTSAADNTLTCSDANGNIDLQAGNDKITVNAGAAMGNIGGNTGNDLIVINGGTAGDINAGNGAASANDTDRIFVFGGNFAGSEVQSGAGTSPFIYFMGGEITGGSIEIRRGSSNAVVVFDGGSLIQDSEIEIQNGNGTIPAAALNPTIYFRSGTLAGEFDLANSQANITVIIDPKNSQDASFYSNLATNAANGGDSTLSTSTLTGYLTSGVPANPNTNHQMVLAVDEMNFGLGNDKLTFDGAVNNGAGPHNLVLGEDDDEVASLDGGGGTNALTVRGGSNIVLDEVHNFQTLDVRGESKLQLRDDSYTFATSTTVRSGSELYISGDDVTFTTSHLELQAADDDDDLTRLAALPSYYNTFQTGGILRIGAPPAGASSGGDDDDDLVMALDDDDEPGETPSGSPVNVFFNVGATTFVNNGTVTMLNGVVGDQMTINDNYQSAGGNLAIDSELGASGSPTDNLTLQQGVTGTTLVFVNNVGGTGAATGHGATDGIEIATSTSGAFAPGSFALAVNNVSGRQEVIAGAFAYQLLVTPDAALLQSDVLTQVPAYVMSPAVALHYSNGTFDTLYKRLGEIRLGQNSDGSAYGSGGAWVKGNYSDVDISPKAGFGFSQDNAGVLFGFDKRIESAAGQYFLGLFGGVGTANADVNATFFGAASKSKVDVDARTFGAYLTYSETRQPGVGFYADLVAKFDDLSLKMSSPGGGRGDVDGFTVGGSGEIGYGVRLGSNLILQPQAQLTYSSYDQDAFVDSFALQTNAVTAESLIGRAGLQLQGNYANGPGVFSPYAIINVLSDFRGDATTTVGGTPFASDIGVTWYNVGGGFTADMGNALKVYGSADYDFGDIEGWSLTGGGKVLW